MLNLPLVSRMDRGGSYMPIDDHLPGSQNRAGGGDGGGTWFARLAIRMRSNTGNMGTAYHTTW